MNAEQPTEPPSPPPSTPPEEEPPAVIHTPVVTTEERLMIDGTYKTITTTDGVESPTLSNTLYYVIDPYNGLAVFRKSETYSDNTQYTVIIQPTTTYQIATVSNIFRTQRYFTDGAYIHSETINGITSSLFPFITSSVTTALSSTRTSYTETWSDTRVFTKETELTINNTVKTVSLDGVVLATKTATRYVVTYPAKTANYATFMTASNYYCYRYQDWSDGTTYKASTPQPKTQMGNTTSVNGVVIPQFRYTAELDYDYRYVTVFVEENPKTSFPYLVTTGYFFNPYGETQTWSDGRTYSI